MQHDTFTEKISLWLDDELSPAEITELQNHLVQCTTCQQVHQTMLRVHHFFQAASATMLEPSPGFNSRFEYRLAHHRPQKSWHLWLGLSVLLLGSLFFFAAGAMVGWLTLVNSGGLLIDPGMVYYTLGILGGLVNDVRAAVNLGGMGVKVAWLIMGQPLFWVYVLVAIGLTGLWASLIQSLYRRASITTQLFVLIANL